MTGHTSTTQWPEGESEADECSIFSILSTIRCQAASFASRVAATKIALSHHMGTNINRATLSLYYEACLETLAEGHPDEPGPTELIGQVQQLCGQLFEVEFHEPEGSTVPDYFGRALLSLAQPPHSAEVRAAAIPVLLYLLDTDSEWMSDRVLYRIVDCALQETSEHSLPAQLACVKLVEEMEASGCLDEEDITFSMLLLRHMGAWRPPEQNQLMECALQALSQLLVDALPADPVLYPLVLHICKEVISNGLWAPSVRHTAALPLSLLGLEFEEAAGVAPRSDIWSGMIDAVFLSLESAAHTDDVEYQGEAGILATASGLDGGPAALWSAVLSRIQNHCVRDERGRRAAMRAVRLLPLTFLQQNLAAVLSCLLQGLSQEASVQIEALYSLEAVLRSVDRVETAWAGAIAAAIVEALKSSDPALCCAVCNVILSSKSCTSVWFPARDPLTAHLALLTQPGSGNALPPETRALEAIASLAAMASPT